MARRLTAILLLLTSCAAPPAPCPKALPKPAPSVEALGAYGPDLICIEINSHPITLGPAATNMTTGCILIDEDWMATIEQRYGRAAVVAIWLHELAHLIQRARGLTDAPAKFLELEADKAMGCGLARLRLPSGPIVKWLSTHTTTDLTHGTMTERSEAIDIGTQKCKPE